jgi:hypothetical protein
MNRKEFTEISHMSEEEFGEYNKSLEVFRDIWDDEMPEEDKEFYK